jgi:HD-GYP domain-containing protein (c-di-GMP phosphodiesterase class II)
VSAISLAIADDLCISNDERYALELAAMLHDIGKIVLPESALNKESPLTEEEWRAMREHPVQGAKIVGTIDELAYVCTVIRHHHERLDGTGYPDGLKGTEIPYLARIISVADAFDAMMSDRLYRSKLNLEEARQQLIGGAGSQFDKDMVDVFVDLIDGTGYSEMLKETAATYE